ncbi:MAG: hypothetical protein IT324_14375 [Anaerolineae bacterium]|nr:hypothetical protein [Anaerolineae bacterium]
MRKLLLVVMLMVVLMIPALKTRAQEPTVFQVTLKPVSPGDKNGFAGMTGTAIIEKAEGWIIINAKLPEGYKTPPKTVFEGWVTDMGGLFDPLNRNNAQPSDQKFGPRFANRTLTALVDSIPYSLSTGALIDDGKGNLSVAMKWPNYNFGPFDMVVITLESDGNETPWDPRPGGPVLMGLIAEGTPTNDVDIDKAMGPMPSLNAGQGLTLRLTKLGETAGLKGAAGKAIILTEGAAADISVTLPQGVKVPEGAALEAYVVDGGKLGNFGPSNAHLADNKLGLPYDNAYVSAIFDAAPFATSLGDLKADDKGVYRLQVHWQKYAFRVYDVMMVTLESDAGKTPWNPRPGTPVLVGAITPQTDPSALLAMPGPDDMTPPSDTGRIQPAAATQAAK